MSVQMTQESDKRSFATRLCELAVAIVAIKQLSEIYSSVMACYAGEITIQMASAASKPFIDAAFSLSKPIVEKVECTAATIDRVASKTLAKFEEKYPIITKTPSEIKSNVTDAASECYNKLQNYNVIKTMVVLTADVLLFTETIADAVLPPDSTCEEDVKEFKVTKDVHANRALVRAWKLGKRVMRRGKRKLMLYRPIKFSFDTVTSLQEKVTDLVGKTSVAGKKVFIVTMYIPNMALQLTGGVIVSAKELDLYQVISNILNQTTTESEGEENKEEANQQN